MLAFQEFQRELGRHIRDPRRTKRPAGVPARRMAVYNDLLFNNLRGFLDACFPLSRQLLGERRWLSLVRTFFREARCRTPYFREIPREFLGWLAWTETLPVPLPPWLSELAHYEWVELSLDVMNSEPPAHDPHGDLLDGLPVFAPAAMNLTYAWPVHRIGTAWRPRKPATTHLLVFRDAGDGVQFIALNPLSSRLIALLQAGPISGRQACLALAGEIAHPHPESLATHGALLLAELRAAGALLGTVPA